MNLAVAVALVSLVVAGVGIWQVMALQRRFQAALGGGDDDGNRSLEHSLADQRQRLATAEAHLDQLDTAYRRLAATGSLASQKFSIVRFNPFGDTGGDQSFVLAVLDANNSGYVLTSIHGREGTRIYVKPIDDGSSKYPLSKEEKQALSQAAKRVPEHPEE